MLLGWKNFTFSCGNVMSFSFSRTLLGLPTWLYYVSYLIVYRYVGAFIFENEFDSKSYVLLPAKMSNSTGTTTCTEDDIGLRLGCRYMNGTTFLQVCMCFILFCDRKLFENKLHRALDYNLWYFLFRLYEIAIPTRQHILPNVFLAPFFVRLSNQRLYSSRHTPWNFNLAVSKKNNYRWTWWIDVSGEIPRSNGDSI